MSGLVNSTCSSEDKLKNGLSRYTLTMDNIAKDLGVSKSHDVKGLSNSISCYGETTIRRESLGLTEAHSYEADGVKFNETTVNRLNENSVLSSNRAWTKGQNRRYSMNDNQLFCKRKSNETRLGDQFTNYFDATNESCFVPAMSLEYEHRKSNLNHRNVDGKRRSIAESARLWDSKEVDEVLIFEGYKASRYLGLSKEMNQRRMCRCVQGTPLKQAIRMASAKVGTSNSGCDKSQRKKYSFGTQGSSTANFGSSVELEFKRKFGCEESMENMGPAKLLSDVLINAGGRETTKNYSSKRTPTFHDLFSLNYNRDVISTPKTAQFLGSMPLMKQSEKDPSLCSSRNGHLPLISVNSYIPRGQILTVVRKTVTGLEIERRSSTEIISIPDTSRSCQLNSCMEYDPPRVKNRTINWVKSQRLLQNRIKV